MKTIRLTHVALIVATAQLASATCSAESRTSRDLKSTSWEYPHVNKTHNPGRNLQQAACAAPCPVNLQGLTDPTSVTWDTNGNIFIAEKAGLVKHTTSWVGNPVNVILDITAVTYYGDHGLTSILWDGAGGVGGSGFLYATYMKINPEFGADGCTDYGQDPGVRPWSAMVGCNIYGRVSRWPISAAGIISGAEQILIDTQTPDVHGE